MRISRFLVTTAVFFLVAVAVLAVSLWQAVHATATLRETRQAVGEAQGQADRAGALQARWQGIADKAGMISDAFLGRNDLASFLGLVEQTASAAHVTEETSIVSQDNGALVLLFRAKGSFPNLFTFMTHINVLPKLLFVQEVRFQAISTETGGPDSLEVLVRVPLRSSSDQSSVAPVQQNGGDATNNPEQ